MQFSPSYGIIRHMNIAERIRAARAAEIAKAEEAERAVKKAQEEKQEAYQQIVRRFNAQILSGLSPIVQVAKEAPIGDSLREIKTVVPDLKTQLSIYIDYSYVGRELGWISGLNQDWQEAKKAEAKRSRLMSRRIEINHIEEITADFDFLAKAWSYAFTDPKGLRVFADPRYRNHAFSRPRLSYDMEWDRAGSHYGPFWWKFMSIHIQHRRDMRGVEIVLQGDEKFGSLRINDPREWRDRAEFNDKIFTVFSHHPGHGYSPYSEPYDRLAGWVP